MTILSVPYRIQEKICVLNGRTIFAYYICLLVLRTTHIGVRKRGKAEKGKGEGRQSIRLSCVDSSKVSQQWSQSAVESVSSGVSHQHYQSAVLSVSSITSQLYYQSAVNQQNSHSSRIVCQKQQQQRRFEAARLGEGELDFLHPPTLLFAGLD